MEQILSNKTQNHNYGVDLLRIVSMYMIVGLHVLYHGGVLDALDFGTANYFFVWVLEICLFCAVNCFALISGYVGVNAKYKVSNIVRLWLQVVFFTLLFTAIFSCVYPEKYFNLTYFLEAIFPVCSKQYWYFSAYFVLFIFIPILNYALNNFSKNAIKYLVIFLSVILMLFQRLGTVLFLLNVDLDILLLITLYLVGGYVKKYQPLKNLKTKTLVTFLISLVVITAVIKFITEIIVFNAIGVANYGGVLVSYYSPTIFFIAFCLLELFSRIRFNKKPKIISFLSPLTFGVYIIHEQWIVKEIFIQDKFISFASFNPMLAVLAVIGTSLLIFIICALIDFIRQKLFDVLKVKTRLEKAESKFKSRLLGS